MSVQQAFHVNYSFILLFCLKTNCIFFFLILFFLIYVYRLVFYAYLFMSIYAYICFAFEYLHISKTKNLSMGTLNLNLWI